MGGWSKPRPGHFTAGKDPVHIVYEEGWASETVWTGAESLAHTGIRFPGRLARSESLYRLLCPGSLTDITDSSGMSVHIYNIFKGGGVNLTSHNTLSMFLMQDTQQYTLHCDRPCGTEEQPLSKQSWFCECCRISKLWRRFHVNMWWRGKWRLSSALENPRVRPSMEKVTGERGREQEGVPYPFIN